MIEGYEGIWNVYDCCLLTAAACSKKEVINEDFATRSISRSDSADLDSGKVRIGDVVIDTTWNGETHNDF